MSASHDAERRRITPEKGLCRFRVPRIGLPMWPDGDSLHSSYMLNRGYAYTTIISSKHPGQTLLSHLASLYSHSTPQAWQEKLNNGEVTLDGVTATGSELVAPGQTLVSNRPP